MLLHLCNISSSTKELSTRHSKVQLIAPIIWVQWLRIECDTSCFLPFSGRLLWIVLFRRIADVLACCNADGKEYGTFYKVESYSCGTILLSPSSWPGDLVPSIIASTIIRDVCCVIINIETCIEQKTGFN